MQSFRNLRFVLIQGSIFLLVLTSCLLGFTSHHYRHRLCAHVQQAIHLTLVTVLAQQTIDSDVQREQQDALAASAWQSAASYHVQRSENATHWAHVLHNQSLALQTSATVLSTQVMPRVQEVEEEQAAMVHPWCEVTLFHTVCHFVSSGTTRFADTTSSRSMRQQQHWTMLQQQQQQPASTEAWVLQVLANQTTVYTEAARSVQDYVAVLEQQAVEEEAVAAWDLEYVSALEHDQAVLYNQTLQLEADIASNVATRKTVWQQAQHEGRVAFGTGLLAVCLAIGGIVALVVWLVVSVVTTTSTASWPHFPAHTDQIILRRCLIAWWVTGVVNELSTHSTTSGDSHLYSALASHNVTLQVAWIVGLAGAIGVAQAVLLHDFFASTTTIGRHVRSLLLDSAKFTGVSILHILTVWLLGSGLVPGPVATILLNPTTQLVLVGMYVLILVWEPPVFPTGEATTVLTGDASSSDESTPLHASAHPKYLAEDEDASSAVIYLGGSSPATGSGASTTQSGAASHVGFVASWNVLLLACLVQNIGMVAPGVLQLHPFGSGFVWGCCLATSIAVACQWMLLGALAAVSGIDDVEDDRLPRTIVV